MKLGRAGISCFLAALLGMAPAAQPQTLRSDWAAVAGLQAGDRLVIELRTGKSVAGQLINVADTGMTVSVRGKDTVVNKPEVRKVYRVTGNSAKNGALAGTIVGAAAGAGLGAAAGCDRSGFLCLDRRQTIPAGAAVGAVIGVLTGFLIGKTRHKRDLIYETP